MVFKSTPASLNQKLSVPRTNNNGNPELNPKKNNLIGHGLKNTDKLEHRTLTTFNSFRSTLRNTLYSH